jgi:hypothetical protein
MTIESIERLRFYLTQTRTEFLRAANNSRLNGYATIAAEEENKAQFAKLLLEELDKERGEPQCQHEK